MVRRLIAQTIPFYSIIYSMSHLIQYGYTLVYTESLLLVSLIVSICCNAKFRYLLTMTIYTSTDWFCANGNFENLGLLAADMLVIQPTYEVRAM